MNKAIVSVVIPTYNYGQFVVEAVESVLAQTYREFEIIVVDDGSEDDTRDRLGAYMDRIRYLYQDNQGPSAARNTGIRAATGEFIALLDSDDIWHRRKLELQMDYLDRHSDAQLVGTNHVWGDRDQWLATEFTCPPNAEEVPLTDLVVRTRFGSCSAIFRKTCFSRVGLFDTALSSAEDRDMWIRVASHFQVVKLTAPLWWYRLHGSSMSNAAARMEENERKVLRKTFAEIPALRRRILLKLLAFSYAAYSAAYMHDAAGDRLVALRRMVRSFLLWPLPYRREEVNTRFARPKMMAKIVLHLLGMAGNTPRPQAAAVQGEAPVVAGR